MKKGLSVIIGLCFCLSMVAQRDTTFFDADWDTVASRDGATYFRLFDRLESEKRHYFFIDYYITGEKQAAVVYKDPRGKVKCGEWTWYYKNGQVKKIGSYVDGMEGGDWFRYFENGDLKSQLYYKKGEENFYYPDAEYVELYDEKSREHILSNGEGLYLTYHDNGDTNVIGRVAKKQKNGTWKSYRNDGSLYYVEEHKNGELKKGMSYDKEGKKYTYTKEQLMPSYVGGQAALMQYLGTIVYPRQARIDDIEGTVYVQFLVDRDGNVINVTIARSSSAVILDEAALNHVSKSKKWIPGYERGQPVRVQYVVPIKFKLG
ncbi:hypothetical protein BH09BAC1_BH09BAC1_04840 [soil metagenome]